ncbi:hypothetical protein DYD21_10565 [Rhodohalobacter sp. SW132]|uniref:hypothetical protein n=1 Tax=Rhodohalobacter sp. SW132 TaxID=2293433 RepID=UPI000E221390|nr:hypothetical protein [Rhodohalobacter sp. SW132]REL33839.1 hypothetical protein DYD21_10565 [Rhodohalobacter sp. SW132]
MSTMATYSFLPWVRQGIANQIEGQSGNRATIPVELTLVGETLDNGSETRPPIKKDIEIYGPGDITGIASKAIIRMEPGNRITNFEPNYLPFIEFYDEDMPWRYSPVKPQEHRLLPWIMLVVLKEDEFKDGKNIKERPLPYIRPEARAKFPSADQLWAWAHVHVNKTVIDETFLSEDAEAIQEQLASVLDEDPDMAYSRIMCPRKLEANTAYHAFLVPVFESGRRAGVGKDPFDANADEMAWNDANPDELPYYHRYYFRTGTVGDFEYLVRLLEPQPVDSRVGLRDMDVQKPGANIEGIRDDSEVSEEQKLDGILKLGGALRIPDIFYSPEEFAVVEKYRKWATLNGTESYPHPFQEDLAAFINLTDSYEVVDAGQANKDSGITEVSLGDEVTEIDPDTDYDIEHNPDPLITAPLYGRWHALAKRLLKEREGSDISPNNNWIHELNLDPRWRVASGFGTKIVQENQEDYMKAAWEQIGDVLESNKKIRGAQLAKETTYIWHQSHMKTIKEQRPEKWAMLAAPLHKRVTHDFEFQENGTVTHNRHTIYHQVNRSRIPRAALSVSMRKFTRPRGTLMKRLPFDDDITPDNLLDRINKGEVSAAPERETPPEILTPKDLYEETRPKNVPGFVIDLLSEYPWMKWFPLLLAILLFIILIFVNPGTTFYSVGIVFAAAMVYLYRRFSTWSKQQSAAESVLEENQTPEAVDDLPRSPDFRISTPEENFTPSRGTEDSEEAGRFKKALKDAYTFVEESVRQSQSQPKPALDISLVNDVMFESLDPEITIPRWVWGSVIIPDRIRDQLKEEFVEAMAYPEIDLPMYKPLVDQSSELFLPNINHIAQNSISILETNQKFIESYMVGLNHEFARELLWREYPTDQRGSYFRQFWEARGYFDSEDLTEEELKEKLKDIPQLHRWSKYSDLGDHDHREAEGEDEEVVLVIRGELLKKYPNAVIYAQRAVWKDEDGEHVLNGDSDAIDPTKERDLRPLSEEEQGNPPRTVLKSPLYEAKVEPDIYFFGFDLTVCEAKGGTGKESEPVDERCAGEGITWDDPGWFFVIKERPGEPRFGLGAGDESHMEDGKLEVWNDLGWIDIDSGEGFIDISGDTPTITVNQILEDGSVKKEQQSEDLHIEWNKEMSSAELAYILYQVPVLVAIHATEMLPDIDE